jgi:DNA-binding transcriptional MerR regulator
MTGEPEILIEVGGVARRFGVSPSTIREWEEAGKIPRGMRLEESRRRVWREVEIETSRERIAARRAERLSGPEAA